jgi:putative oxidoreductase
MEPAVRGGLGRDESAERVLVVVAGVGDAGARLGQAVGVEDERVPGPQVQGAGREPGIGQDPHQLTAGGVLVVDRAVGVQQQGRRMAVTTTAVAIAGPGRFAVDRAIPLLRAHRVGYGVAVAALTLVLFRG